MGRSAKNRRRRPVKTPEVIENQNLYQVLRSPKLGRYLTATEAIPAGKLILEEEALVVGPVQDGGSVCLGCYRTIRSVETSTKCSLCGWPICSQSCPGLHSALGHSRIECSKLAKVDEKPCDDMSIYNAIVPLRCLLLRETDEAKWYTIEGMESHDEIRKGIPSIWLKNQKEVVDRLRNKWKLDKYSEEEIHSVCGYLEVNCFSIGKSDREVRGLYPTAYLCAHNCTANTSHVDGNNFKMFLRASQDISKGEPITISYSNSLLGTVKRRHHLKETKFFDCECPRCCDKTEFGTYLSALKCQTCGEGAVLPINPLDSNSIWKCDRAKCKSQIEPTFALDLAERSYSEVERKSNTIEDYENIILKYERLLHKNHYSMVNAKYSLSQMYGKAEGYLINQMSQDQLKRKYEVCFDVLNVFNKLEPGLTTARGLTMYEIHAPLMILSQLQISQKTIQPKELKSNLKRVVDYLRQASNILEFEFVNTSEGDTYLAAQQALLQTNDWKTVIDLA